MAAWANAGTPKEKARAAVAVAKARLELAKRAELPDSNNRAGATVDTEYTDGPTPLTEEEFAELQKQLKSQKAISDLPVPEDDGRLVPTVDDLARPEVEETPLEISEATWERVSPRQMQITFESTPLAVSGPKPLQAQLVIRSVADCKPCERQHREVERKLRPLKWTIGESDTDQIKYEHFVSGPDITFPWIILYQNGQQIGEWHGYQTTEFLSTELLNAWNTARDVPTVAAAGFGGTLKARSYIESSLSWWRNTIGTTKPDGTPTKAQVAWRRTGGQTFPLLHQKPEQWSCANIMGSLGEFSFEAPGSLLPVPEVLVGYRRSMGRISLRGDVSIDEQQLGFPGDLQSTAANMEATPAGIGPMELLTILQTVKAIVSLLNPQVDLTLGGQITATCWLDDPNDTLHVEFHDAPRIKVVEWFTFDLGVKELTASPTNAHLGFDGSRWIKSRDLRVE